MTQATLSFNMTGREICIEHNNRKIPVPHSDVQRESDNYYWSGNKSLEQTYSELFANDVAEYNSKQKRNDRKIGSYLQKIFDNFEREKEKIRKLRGQGATRRTIRQNQKAVKPCYEFIISLGNKTDTPQFCCKNGEQRFLAKEILERYIDDFARRYNGKDYGIEMFNAAIHLDETENNGVVHGHINIVFHSNDNKRGMQHQVSMNKALNQLGFFGNEKTLPITEWEESERQILRTLCAEYGIEIVNGKGGKKHLHKEEYILQQEKEKHDRAKEEFTDFLFENEKGNVFLVMKENDELREEVSALQDKTENENSLISQMWEEYKSDNSQYWKRYNEYKVLLKKEIAIAVTQNNHDRERLQSILNSLLSNNDFILFRLFRLLSALFLKYKIDRQEEQLRELQHLNKELKKNAKAVCNASQTTAKALKSKDIENICAALEMWERTLKSVNMSIENQLQYTASHKHWEEAR